jgi:dienelactone hydrolase
LSRDGNFLVRSRARFTQQGLAVAVIDTPSDRNNLVGTFRESAEHVADIGAAIAWARQRFGKPVWLVGTSRGTHSVAFAATSLGGAAAPDGIVLTSSVLARSRVGQTTARPVQELPLEQLKMPVLVAHHAQDECVVCPPSQLPVLMSKLPAATSRLVTYQGGRSVGDPCEAFAWHGFNGIEDQVVADIAGWIAAPAGAAR